MSHFLKVVLISIYVVSIISIVGANNLDQDKESKAEVSMAKESKMMDKFDFLIGNWNLESRVPKSSFSEAETGTGTGRFKRALNDKYVYFDYSASYTTGDGAAHGIFAWDEKAKIYRYWWFENSGNFLEATCNFVNKNTLLMNWHDTLILQTFTKIGPNKVILRMEHPNAKGKYELILEVILTKI